MPVITIREQQQTEAGFEAILSFDGRVNYPITITEPFSRQEEQQLEWYFEEWLVYPMLNTVKAEQAADSVKTYGQQLFKQVFQTNFDAYSEYRQLRGKLNQVQIEIESQTPEFQALHWEALRDPELPRPFGVDCVMLRKSTKPVPVSAYVQPSPVINLLVVTARPKEENDVGYRTISRSLIEAIEKCQLRVNVELLRPGTYEALERHLEEKGAGFYHIIHFDAHGGLMSYEQIQAGAKANRYLYQQRYGREDLQAFEGVKAFLFLEGETKGKADPIEAKELADLLTGKGIPVCILNACQSGKQLSVGKPNPPAPLASRQGQDESLTPPLASRQGQDDSVTPPLASRQGQDESLTPPLASRQGQDESLTPPLASRQGQDDSVTPSLASRQGQDDSVTPSLASRQGQDDSVTPSLASRQGQDDSVTPSLASRQGQDDSVTPSLASRQGQDDSVTPSLASRQGQDDSVTPSLASRQGQDDSVTPSLASRQGQDDSVTPPLASRQGQDESLTPPLASRQGQDESLTPPLASRQGQDDSLTPSLASRQRNFLNLSAVSIASPNRNTVLWGGIWRFSRLRRRYCGTISCCCKGWGERAKLRC